MLRDHPDVIFVTRNVPGAPLNHEEWSDFAEFGDFYADGVDGTGQTIAVLECGPGVHESVLFEAVLGVNIAAHRLKLDCGMCGGICIDAECGDRHTDAVAASIAARHSSGGPSACPGPTCTLAGAVGANLIIANGPCMGAAWVGPALGWLVAPVDFVTGLDAPRPAVAVLSTEFQRGVVDTSDLLIEDHVFDEGTFILRGSGDSQENVATSVAAWDALCDPAPAVPCEVVDCDGYAPLCVGGYDPAGAFGEANFAADDTVAFGPSGTTGSFLNPPGTDRELPDVVGPWFNTLPDCFAGGCPFVAQIGTSFSSGPHAALAAFAVAEEPSWGFQPELLKAVLMASALGHGINLGVSTYLAPDDADGVGAPEGETLRLILDGPRFPDPGGDALFGQFDRDDPAQFAPVGTADTIVTDLEPFLLLPAGIAFRAVLVWSACPEPAGTPTTLELADLDLGLFFVDPVVGELNVKWSVSVDNGVEMVQTITDEAGIYFLRVSSATSAWPDCSPRTPGGTVDYGLAWVTL